VTAPVDATAALERGRPVVIVTPPAPECAGALWPLVQGNAPVLILTESPTAASAWSAAVPQPLRFHAVTGLERSARVLTAGGADVLAGCPSDFAALLARSALKVDTIRTVVLAWPEALQGTAELEGVGAVLAEMKDARRVVLSWNPTSIEALLDAHARRPHVLGDLPIGENARPLPPVGAARYVLSGPGGREAAMDAALDALDPGTALVWRRGMELAGSVNVVVCADLPTRDELSTLGSVGSPVLVLTPDQLPDARSIASPLTPVPSLSGGTAAREARAAIAARLERGYLAADLALLAPLLDRYDAAEVAAAVLSIGREMGGGKREAGSAPAARVKVYVSVGKKDRAAAKDIVGALIREAGLSKDDIGRIDVRDTFSLVDVAGSAAERAVARLSGMMIRGRRVNARLDQ